MEDTVIILIMLLAVAVSGFLARITRMPLPLVQIALGAALFYSSIASVELDPEVFFLLLMPPMLFLDGWRIPKDDLFREAPTILTLALGLVVFTVLGVGLLIHWLIPEMPLPVAFALAAVISPTDPIAVSAITARTPMPIRMRRILEGEALFNDASGLVCMRFAVAAALTGSFVLSNALVSFVWVALGGLAIGAAVTWLMIRAMSSSLVRLGEDGNHAGGAQILISLLIPSGVYLLAERLHCSGILAAVAAGITMGFIPHSHSHAVTRIRRTAVWDTVRLATNGSIFVLLGQQMPTIVFATGQTVRLTGHQNPWWLLLYALIIVVALASLRLVWVWASMKLAFSGVRAHNGLSTSSYRRLVIAMSLAGVRGAITLAGVLTLPLKMIDGTPFPGRDLAIILAAGVIILSLILAAVALPHALRNLELPAEADTENENAADEKRLRSAAAEAAIRAIESAPHATTDAEEAGLYADTSTRIVTMYRLRIDGYKDSEGILMAQEKADHIERQLRLVGLHAERDEILGVGQNLGIKEMTLRKIEQEIDLQEARYSS
jgi:CPA1 family monovalent cation:H+ antiporter